MKQSARESLDAYYREAGSWADDQRDALRASRRIAWIVAIAVGVIAVIEAIAIIVMMPLKTVVPYTLMVDKTTGYVQELKPLDAQKIAPDTALTRSFLVQYVIARESYDATMLQSSYRKVQLWSAQTARSDYVNGMQAANPDSPLSRYPRTTLIDTQVKSISSLGGNSALVRFETVRRDAGGQPQPPEAWVAIINYRFSNAPMNSEDRFINPLGFQVFRYRRDQETMNDAPQPVAVAPAQATLPGTQAQVVTPKASGTPAPPPPSNPPNRRLPDGTELTL
jgi:type IV secretion system protein VirB8